MRDAACQDCSDERPCPATGHRDAQQRRTKSQFSDCVQAVQRREEIAKERAGGRGTAERAEHRVSGNQADTLDDLGQEVLALFDGRRWWFRRSNEHQHQCRPDECQRVE